MPLKAEEFLDHLDKAQETAVLTRERKRWNYWWAARGFFRNGKIGVNNRWPYWWYIDLPWSSGLSRGYIL